MLDLWEAEPVPDSPLEASCLELPLSILCPMILQERGFNCAAVRLLTLGCYTPHAALV